MNPLLTLPGKTFIGFMRVNGDLVGQLSDPRTGHAALASQLSLLGISEGLQKGIIAITVGKGEDGTIHAFGSGKFGPLTDAQRELAKRLIK